MNYVKERYNSPTVYVTENGKAICYETCIAFAGLRRCSELNSDAGMDDGNSPFTSIQDALKDSKRIKYHNGYLNNLAASIKY